jgi:hypothetical protein
MKSGPDGKSDPDMAPAAGAHSGERWRGPLAQKGFGLRPTPSAGAAGLERLCQGATFRLMSST